MSATIDSIFHYMKDHLKLSVDRVIHPNRMQINISGSKSAIRYHAEPDYSSLCVKYVTKNAEIVTLCEKNKKEKKPDFRKFKRNWGKNLTGASSEKGESHFFNCR